MPAEIGLIGLAVMGQNLVLNMIDQGATVAVYNRTTSVTDEFVASADRGDQLIGVSNYEELAAAIERPRKVMLMVKAGGPVDAVIESLLEVLEPGDVIIDGGNSEWRDTDRRVETVEAAGLLYVGSGVSGGEEGARHGPSIMPGGSAAAWPMIESLFTKVAADAPDGTPVAAWLGPGGSGHFVKMVHNGIEYGDMQVLTEAYALMAAMGLDNDEIAATFDGWRTGVLDSYLVDITAEIFARREPDGTATVDLILDAAKQKGTGKWTVIDAMESGQPVMLVAEAVGGRMVSSMVEQRATGEQLLSGPRESIERTPERLAALEQAVYGAKVVSYAQGFGLLADVSAERGWDLDMSPVAGLWRAGCIIRAAFLGDIMSAFTSKPDLANLLFDDFFADAMSSSQAGLREVVGMAVGAGIATPAMSSALAYYDGMRLARGPANLIQAQRDYFGAHTYERVDRARGEYFHTDWAETGGTATSGSYSA